MAFNTKILNGKDVQSNTKDEDTIMCFENKTVK